ncbi:MAG: ZIP family metal transporter [Anaerolineae bacterium]|nr:ZIP family metal transporter [Anaerolineae bacterium]
MPFLTSLSNWSPVALGLFGGIVITLMNVVGALAVLVWRKPSVKFLDTALGFAAGVMLAASFTSLILPGINYGGIGPVLVGIALGALLLDWSDRVIPHLHVIKGPEGPQAARIRGIWLFILAITLHNMPEGLAVGVGFGAGDVPNAVKLMLAIGIQNIPEGLSVAVSALCVGMGTYFYAAVAGIRAGLVEIPLALFGAIAVQIAQPILPYAMGFAAGAMLWVISDEIVPETHRNGHERLATFGIMAGVIVMLFLDVTLG